MHTNKFAQADYTQVVAKPMLSVQKRGEIMIHGSRHYARQQKCIFFINQYLERKKNTTHFSH